MSEEEKQIIVPGISNDLADFISSATGKKAKPTTFADDFNIGAKHGLRIGAFCSGEGVFIGKGCLEGYDEKGEALGDIFNFFTTRSDLKGVSSWVDSVHKVASIDNLYGHDGAYFGNEAEAIEMMKEGYWVLPTKNMLIKNYKLREDSRSLSNSKGSFIVLPNGSILDNQDGISGFRGTLYWSCSTVENLNSKISEVIKVYQASKNNIVGVDCVGIDSYKAMSRPVRAVPQKLT